MEAPMAGRVARAAFGCGPRSVSWWWAVWSEACFVARNAGGNSKKKDGPGGPAPSPVELTRGPPGQHLDLAHHDHATSRRTAPS
jgi:hypothetical protein